MRRVLLVLTLTLPKAVAAERPPHKVPIIPITVQVVAVDGAPVVDAAWVDAQIDAANRLFADVPVVFRRVALAPCRTCPAQLLTRADRDRALARLAPGVINLRIAAALLDVDEPGRVRRGVHWRVGGDPRRRGVLLSAIAGPEILAHELGHYFGNGHSTVVDNLMSYERGDGPVVVSPAQIETVRRTLRGLIAEGQLRPLKR